MSSERDEPRERDLLAREVGEAVADAMSSCQLADDLLAFASRHRSPADPHGVTRHAARLRARLEVLRQTTVAVLDGERDLRELEMAALLLCAELRALLHSITTGAARDPQPRPSLRRAASVKRSLDEIARAAESNRQAGEASEDGL
jgi:hypothetical protein